MGAQYILGTAIAMEGSWGGDRAGTGAKQKAPDLSEVWAPEVPQEWWSVCVESVGGSTPVPVLEQPGSNSPGQTEALPLPGQLPGQTIAELLLEVKVGAGPGPSTSWFSAARYLGAEVCLESTPGQPWPLSMGPLSKEAFVGKLWEMGRVTDPLCSTPNLSNSSAAWRLPPCSLEGDGAFALLRRSLASGRAT